jgi:hypothetical protein
MSKVPARKSLRLHHKKKIRGEHFKVVYQKENKNAGSPLSLGDCDVKSETVSTVAVSTRTAIRVSPFDIRAHVSQHPVAGANARYHDRGILPSE